MTEIASKPSNPCARSEDLIVEELGEELLVYDMKADRGHCLSPVAARVWRRCDGRTPAKDMSAELDLDPDAVGRALDELTACKLLQPTPELTVVAANGDGATRREVATRFVKAGAVAAAAPLIVSVAGSDARAGANARLLPPVRRDSGLWAMPGRRLLLLRARRRRGGRTACPTHREAGRSAVSRSARGMLVFAAGCGNPRQLLRRDREHRAPIRGTAARDPRGGTRARSRTTAPEPGTGPRLTRAGARPRDPASSSLRTTTPPPATTPDAAPTGTEAAPTP